jgi:hypothetical protein
MKLPLEIRYKIYKILVAPLFGGRNRDLPEMAVPRGIRFKVSDGDYDCAFPELDFGLSVTAASRQPDCGSGEGPEDFLEIYKALQYDSASDSQVPSGWTASAGAGDWFQATSEDSAEETSEESSDEGQNMAELFEVNLEDEVSVWRPACDVQVDRAIDPDPNCSDEWHDYPELLDNCRCSYRQRQDYDTIRCLSYVSRQFNRELGECLWENAIVDFEDLEIFFLFFKDRTAVLRHIKGLVLNIQYYGDCFDTCTSILIEICKFVSQNLDLQFVTIRFATQESLLDNILAVEKVHEWAAAFRSLQIREKFDLCLVISNVEFSRRDSADTDESGGDDDKKLQQKLLDLWLPDALRQPEMTKEVAYGLSRAQ